MKTISMFFMSILTVILIASCESSTGVDDSCNYYQVETFEVCQEKKTARWVGANSMVKSKTLSTNALGDTTVYTTPDGVNLLVRYVADDQTTGDQWLSVAYIDSGITSTYYDTTFAAYDFKVDHKNENGSWGTSFEDGNLLLEYALRFSCDEEFKSENQFITTLNDTGGVYETVKVKTQGIYDAGYDMICQQ